MPDQASKYFSQAQKLKEAGDFKAVRDRLEKAILCNPDFFEARVNLSETCRILGDYSKAIHHLLYALYLKPDFYPGHNALGSLFEKAGDLENAISHVRIAISMCPGFHEAYANLGVLLQKKGDYRAAIQNLKKAASLKPDFFDAHYNLGNCLRDIEEYDEAVACFTTACSLNPLSIEALSNLGEALQITGNIAGAEHCFKKAIDTDPSCAMAFSNYLLTLNYDPGYGPAALFEQHRKFNASFELPKTAIPSFGARDRSPLRRLRIGYVSADFRNHPVSHFLEPIFSSHDKNGFEIFSYNNTRKPDAKTSLFKQLSGHWADVFDMTDSALADAIHSDAIDILVDLSGHSADNRLLVFAQKAAPVQITYLGYPNTSGLSAMDYRITDHIADPIGEARSHSEELVRILPCFCCYTPPHDAPAPGPVPFRRNKAVTFGSTHTLARLNDKVLDLWADLLSRIPSSRLLIMRTTLKGKGLDRLYKRFESHSVDKNRLVIRNTVPAQGHLAVYRDIDVFLDSFPWSGHTSACEALWMGVPVVTLSGDRHAGKMVESVLSCLDMKDCIAGTKEEYLSVAQGLSSDIDKLEGLRSTLRERMLKSPLCDGAAFTKNLEDAYRRLWQVWCGKQQK